MEIPGGNENNYLFVDELLFDRILYTIQVDIGEGLNHET